MDIDLKHDRESIKNSLIEVLDYLTERERQILELRFGLTKKGKGKIYTTKEIASILNVSGRRINQIENFDLQKLKKYFIEQEPSLFFEEKKGGFHCSLPVDKGIILINDEASEKLIVELAKNPILLKKIDRRKFEEIIAEIWRKFGYEVELTKRTRDGGKDIIAISRERVNVKYLIECKRPEPENPVGISIVRGLHSVVTSEGATKGIIATTTRLTKDAKILINEHKWILDGKEYNDILGWVSEYIKSTKGAFPTRLR